MKHLALFTFTLFIALNTLAQDFKGGAMVGLNATQVAGDGLGGFDKLGLNVGGFVQIPLDERISVSVELVYSQKGSQRKPDPDNGDYEQFILRLHYAEIPLLLNFRFNDVVLDVGGSVGFLMKSTSEHNGAERANNPPYEDFEIAGIIGGKYLITENFFGGARFSHSIVPIRPTPDPTQVWNFYDAGQFNQVLQFNLGWIF